MANLAKWKGGRLVKTLLIGSSGAGKTGSLAALASAGYNIRILDLENKLGALLNVLQDPKSPYTKDAITRVSAITLQEPRKAVGGKLIIQTPSVYTKVTGLLDHWKDEDEDLGNVGNWTDRDVLVPDSLTAYSRAAFRYILGLNGRLNQRPWEADYGSAQELIEDFLELITSALVPCHVVVPCHIKYMTPKGEAVEKAFPQTVGKAISPLIGRYFDAALLVQSTGSGVNAKRKILTNSTHWIELKNTAPLRVAQEYPLETGLADYFKAVLGAHPNEAPLAVEKVA